MKITPLELRQYSFEKTFRGYNIEEVDNFLSSLSQEWERLLNDSKMLRMQLEIAEKEATKLREIEFTLFKTLKTAEDTSNMITEQANQQAEKNITEANERADQIVNDARQQADKIVQDALEKADQLISGAQEKATYIKEDVLSDVQALERDFKTMRHYKDNLLVQMRSMANATMAHVERFEGKFDNATFEDKFEKANELLKTETAAASVEQTPAEQVAEEASETEFVTENSLLEELAAAHPAEHPQIDASFPRDKHPLPEQDTHHEHEFTPAHELVEEPVIDTTIPMPADAVAAVEPVADLPTPELTLTEEHPVEEMPLPPHQAAPAEPQISQPEAPTEVPPREFAHETRWQQELISPSEEAEAYKEEVMEELADEVAPEREPSLSFFDKLAALKQTHAEQAAQQAAQASAEPTAPTATVVSSSVNKLATPQPVLPEEDDLEKIEGIGPRAKEVLFARGIRTFRELAIIPAFKIKEYLDAEGSQFNFVDPTTWTEQALLAAEGRWDDLAARQAELLGGRDTDTIGDGVVVEETQPTAIPNVDSGVATQPPSDLSGTKLDDITEEMLEKVNKVKNAIKKAMAEKSDKPEEKLREDKYIPTLNDVLNKNRRQGGSFFDNVE